MDFFADEQMIYEDAKRRIGDVKRGAAFDFIEYERLAEKYGKLLRHARLSTRLANNLFESNLDLTDRIQYDPLTGVYNRHFLEQQLGRYKNTLSRSSGLISVLFLDVDNYKAFNDTYGHNVGDDCLRSIAEVLKESVTREDDFVARFGGDEFVIVLPHTDETGASFTARRVIRNIKKKEIIHKIGNVLKYVTVSIGGTTVKTRHTHDVKDYLKRCDEAMYLSKRKGFNEYTYLQFVESV